MNKRIIISEEEKKSILTQHASKGTSISENINEFFYEDEEFGDYEGDEESEEKAEKLSNMEPTYKGLMGAKKPSKMFGSFSDDHGWFDEDDRQHIGDFDFDFDEEEFDEYEPFAEKYGDKTKWFAPGEEGKKFFDKYKSHYKSPFKVRSRREEDLMESSEDEFPYEPAPRGMRSARSRADFKPAGQRETEIGDVFGKYSEEIPPIVIRYMRKNPRRIIQRLFDIYGDKMMDYIEDAQNK